MARRAIKASSGTSTVTSVLGSCGGGGEREGGGEVSPPAPWLSGKEGGLGGDGLGGGGLGGDGEGGGGKGGGDGGSSYCTTTTAWASGLDRVHRAMGEVMDSRLMPSLCQVLEPSRRRHMDSCVGVGEGDCLQDCKWFVLNQQAHKQADV